MKHSDVEIGMRVAVLWANGDPEGEIVSLDHGNGWYKVKLDRGGFIHAHPNAMEAK
jgi:hypothetical protein